MRIAIGLLACAGFASAAPDAVAPKAFSEGHRVHYELRASDAFGMRFQALPDLDLQGVRLVELAQPRQVLGAGQPPVAGREEPPQLSALAGGEGLLGPAGPDQVEALDELGVHAAQGGGGLEGAGQSVELAVERRVGVARDGQVARRRVRDARWRG